MNYLDSNFATALYFKVPGQTEMAVRFLRRNSRRFVFSELAELECRRAFIAGTGKPHSENWLRLQATLAEGTWQREPMPWSQVAEKAGQIVDRFGAGIRAGTLDTLHIAHALLCGCTWFLSFDSSSNARVLASACRLRVFPELTPAERNRMTGKRTMSSGE